MTVIMPIVLKMFPRKLTTWIIWGVFGLYVLGNMYFTMLSRVPDSEFHLDLTPFRVYGRLFVVSSEESNTTGFVPWLLGNTLPVVGLILNILLYYPLGYLIPILFPKLKSKQVVFIGCLCSMATEATQYLLKMGWCETDDVIHNTLGTAIGVWMWLWQSQRVRKVSVNSNSV